MLKKEINKHETLQHRYAEDKVKEFIYSKRQQHDLIMAVHGLDNTGKTLIMDNTVKSLDCQCVYYEASENDSIKGIYKTLLNDQNNGIKVIFIDNITKVPDFQRQASIFSDYFSAVGCQVVLCGDSYDFKLAAGGELFGRVQYICTTYIPYIEHFKYITDEKTPDSYIKYGGVINKSVIYDYASALSYIDTAITAKFCNAMKKSRYDAKDHVLQYDNLNNIVRTIVTLFAGTLQLDSSETGNHIQCISMKYDCFNDFMGSDDHLKNFTDKVNSNLISGPEISLRDMNSLGNILKNINLYSQMSRVRREYTDEKNWFCCDVDYYPHLLQPALQYRMLEEQTMTIEDDDLRTSIQEKAKAEMLQDIIYYDICKALQKDFGKQDYETEREEFWKDSRLIGKYDTIVWDSKTNSYWTVNVKYGHEKAAEVEDFLSEPSIKAFSDRMYGHHNTSFILYFGDTLPAEGRIQYYNISEFMEKLNLHKDFWHFQ